jgi:hypothetical protein
MTTERIAIIFGVIFLLIGIAGFSASLAPVSPSTGEAYLFGVFAVNPMHNWVHILTGVIGILVGLAGYAGSKLYFKVFGIIYALVTLVGLAVGHRAVMGMALNVPDTILHLVAAVIALYLGFAERLPGWKREDTDHVTTGTGRHQH